MASYLRVEGRHLEPERWLQRMGVVPPYVGHKGDRLPGDRRARASCFNVKVSGRGFEDFQRQLADAKRFLRAHSGVLRRLTRHTTVESAVLDFGISARVDGRTVFAQFVRFPADLVALAAEAGIALEASLYPVCQPPKKRKKTG